MLPNTKLDSSFSAELNRVIDRRRALRGVNYANGGQADAAAATGAEAKAVAGDRGSAGSDGAGQEASAISFPDPQLGQPPLLFVPAIAAMELSIFFEAPEEG